MSNPFKRNQKKEGGGKKSVTYDEETRKALDAMEARLKKAEEERQQAEQRFAEQLAEERLKAEKAESDKLKAEADKLKAEADKLKAEADKLKAEADKAVLGQQLNKAEERANNAEEEKVVLGQQVANLDGKLNKRVKVCIDGSPFSTHAFKPAWGDEIHKGESNFSTKTSKAWLPIGKEHVRRWTEEQLVMHLEKADHWVVTHEGNEKTKLLDVIFAGKAEPLLQRLLNGTTAGNNAGIINDRAKLEKDVEDKLLSYLWTPLKMIMGGEGKALADRFPVGNHILTRVRNCGSSASTGTLVPFPEQYSKFYKNDKTIETVSQERENLVFPDAKKVSEDAHKASSLLCSRIMVEIKPDVLCPLAMKEGDVLRNIAVGGDLYDYMQSDYFDSDYNPVAQVVTYAAASRTNFVMIHTFNHMTLGFIDESQENQANSVPITLLSRKFDCTSCDPPFPSRPTWSLWEVLIRFILAAKGEWYRHRFPDSLKQLFTIQIDSKKQANEEKKRSTDEKSGEKDSSTANKREFGGNGGGGGVVESDSFTTLSYADLWDPLRFAIPATHSIEEECSPERLPDDAEVIGEGRMGTVYRKQLHGYDAAVKLLVFYDIRYIDGRDQHPIILRGEMENEFNVYNHLGKLQGMTIPKLLWYGELVPGMSDALVTEYAGEAFPTNPTPLQIANCLAALDSLHQNGVLHGDVALRNFVCHKDQVFILDFGFSVIRTDEDDATWESEVTKEKELLQKEFGRSRKRLFEG